MKLSFSLILLIIAGSLVSVAQATSVNPIKQARRALQGTDAFGGMSEDEFLLFMYTLAAAACELDPDYLTKGDKPAYEGCKKCAKDPEKMKKRTGLCKRCGLFKRRLGAKKELEMMKDNDPDAVLKCKFSILKLLVYLIILGGIGAVVFIVLGKKGGAKTVN